jgi:hypothetical protein
LARSLEAMVGGRLGVCFKGLFLREGWCERKGG